MHTFWITNDYCSEEANYVIPHIETTKVSPLEEAVERTIAQQRD
jgi:hypothetical protein